MRVISPKKLAGVTSRSYTGSLPAMKAEEALELVELAARFLIAGLAEAASEIVVQTLSAENLQERFDFAEQHNSKALRDRIFLWLAYNSVSVASVRKMSETFIDRLENWLEERLEVAQKAAGGFSLYSLG